MRAAQVRGRGAPPGLIETLFNHSRTSSDRKCLSTGGAWPSSLVVNATTRQLVVMGSIPNWATTSANRTLRSRVQFPESPKPGNVYACAG